MMMCEGRACTSPASRTLTPRGTSYSVYSCAGPMCLLRAKERLSKDFPGHPVLTNPYHD